MPADLLALAALNALLLAAGAGVTRALGAWSWWRDLPLGLAYVVGVASAGVAATLLLVAGASLAVWQIVLVCLALAAGLLLRRQGPARERARERFPRPVALALAAYFALLGANAAFQPLWTYDAWAQWSAKAKAIVLFDGLDEAALAMLPNSDYPPLLPALEAFAYRFAGLDTRLLHLQLWLLLAAFVLALVELLRDRVRRAVLWPVVAAIALAPSLAFQVGYALADLPLAVFFGLAGVCAWRWLEDGDRTDLALLAVLCAAALATKADALLFVGALLLTLLVLARRRWPAVVAAAAASAVAVVPWRVWAAAHGLENDVTRKFDDPDEAATLARIPVAAARLVREAIDPSSWLALAPLVLVALVLAAVYARRRDGVVLAAGTLALCYAGLVGVYWRTPFELAFHLDTSARRVVTAPLVLAASLVPLLLERALDGRYRDA